MSKAPVFLERQSYRRRRLMDAARLLPLLGAAMFAVPLLWPMSAGRDDAQPAVDAVSMSHAITFVFGAWAILILTVFAFGVAARRLGDSDSPHRPEQG